MKVLTIRNVPNELYGLLSRRTKRHRRSLQQEALTVLERVRALEGEPAVVRVQGIRKRLSGRVLGNAVDEIRRERDR